MAKRHITQQQKRRISQQQEKRRARAGANLPAQAQEQNLGQEQHGQVITNFGKTLLIEDSQGKLHRCKPRQNLDTIVCGDQVVWQEAESGEGVVVAVSERQSLLQKPGFGGKLKPIAANVDQIMIVCAVQPEPNPYLIDRYIVAAENLPATPIICINKIDRLNTDNRARIEALETIYSQLGYAVLRASNVTDQGFAQLDTAVSEHTTILVGLSGVGKSSIIQHLLPDQDIRIGELSAASGEGTHTTTQSTLYHLPCGGNLIDSPGVRDFGLWNSSAQDILRGFKELAPLEGHCKFSNCSHQQDPGCAIQEAAQHGKIHPQRFASYQKMIEEYT